MTVAALLITSDVSLTLVNDGGGWRFSRWTDGHGMAVARPLTPDDLTRRFDGVESAAAYFRERYDALGRTTPRAFIHRRTGDA